MASSLPVLSVLRPIFDSERLEAERFAKKYSTQRISSDEEMDDSFNSLEDEEMDTYFGLETLSLILKLWLRRIHLTEQDRRKNLQQFEHEIFITQEEVIKPYKALLMLGHYDLRLKEACHKLLIEKEKVNFKMAEDDRRRLDMKSVFVCSILGLKLDFLDCLEEMETKFRGHWTLEDWIITLLQSKCASIRTEEEVSLNEELLVAMGFEPLSAAIEKIIERAGMMQLHLEACEWPEIFVADEFKYNPLLSSDLVVKFPLKSSVRDQVSENETVPRIPNIINLVMKELDTSRITRASVLADERNVVLFHGTDHQSAADILERGIYLSTGRQKRDFSCGAGFYLTKNLDDALNWAKSTTAKPAILMFQVNREYLDNARKLTLFENEEKWQEIVSTFRSGLGMGRIMKSVNKESFDLIEGPVATVRRTETCNCLVLEPIPLSYQMCLISQDFAEKFEQNLHSILFLEISA